MKPSLPAPRSGQSIVDYINANWRQIDCAELQQISDIAMIAALATGDFLGDAASAGFKAIQVALDAAWYTNGCGTREDKPDWPDDPNWWDGQQCQAVAAYGYLWLTETAIDGGQVERDKSRFAREIIGWEYVDDDIPGTRKSVCTYIDGEDGTIQSATNTTFNGEMHYWWIKPRKNEYCVGQNPDWEKPSEPLGPIIVEPEIEQCKWAILPVDSYVDAQNVYWTKYAVTPDNPACGDTFHYWGSQRGPVYCPPEDPNCAPPDGRSGNIPNLPSFEYTLYGNCEKAEDWGEDPDDFEQPILDFYGGSNDGITGLAERLDAIGEMLGWLTLLPLNTCGCEKPKLEGRWVTSQWISEQNSPDSGIRLRKRIRWRTKSSRTDAELAEFFKDFWWDAGPFCVGHKGAWWGTPQVWAASVLEGQRVIREIAREAGIDPDLEGQWWDSVSRNPRFGMTGRMRIRRLEGHPWISSRDGSNMLPMG